MLQTGCHPPTPDRTASAATIDSVGASELGSVRLRLAQRSDCHTSRKVPMNKQTSYRHCQAPHERRALPAQIRHQVPLPACAQRLRPNDRCSPSSTSNPEQRFRHQPGVPGPEESSATTGQAFRAGALKTVQPMRPSSRARIREIPSLSLGPGGVPAIYRWTCSCGHWNRFLERVAAPAQVCFRETSQNSEVLSVHAKGWIIAVLHDSYVFGQQRMSRVAFRQRADNLDKSRSAGRQRFQRVGVPYNDIGVDRSVQEVQWVLEIYTANLLDHAVKVDDFLDAGHCQDPIPEFRLAHFHGFELLPSAGVE